MEIILEVNIRLADNSEGQLIEKLTNENGFTLEGLDWSTVYPYWLVAIHEEEIIGAIQVCFGRPAGRLEFLSIKKEIDPRLKSSTIKKLLTSGGVSLSENGSKMTLIMVPFEMKSHKKALKKQDYIIVSNGNLIGKKL